MLRESTFWDSTGRGTWCEQCKMDRLYSSTAKWKPVSLPVAPWGPEEVPSVINLWGSTFPPLRFPTLVSPFFAQLLLQLHGAARILIFLPFCTFRGRKSDYDPNQDLLLWSSVLCDSCWCSPARLAGMGHTGTKAPTSELSTLFIHSSTRIALYHLPAFSGDGMRSLYCLCW